MATIELGFSTVVAEFYTYKSAKVETSIWINLTPLDIEYIRRYLHNNKYKLDNHICWKDALGTCFYYSDRSLGIGTTIIKGNW